MQCPVLRVVLVSQVSFKRGSTVRVCTGKHKILTVYLPQLHGIKMADILQIQYTSWMLLKEIQKVRAAALFNKMAAEVNTSTEIKSRLDVRHSRVLLIGQW